MPGASRGGGAGGIVFFVEGRGAVCAAEFHAQPGLVGEAMRLLRRGGQPWGRLFRLRSLRCCGRRRAGFGGGFFLLATWLHSALVRSAFFCSRSSVPQLLQKLEPARLAVPQCGQRTTDME